MKTCIFLSSLIDAKQRGGAYLRNKAIIKIYENLGFDVTVIYRSEVLERKSMKQLWKGFIYGQVTRNFFSRAHVEIPPCDLLHVDHLRFLNWNLDYGGTRPFVVYNAHNLEFESYFVREEQDKAHVKRFKNYELDCMGKVDLTLVCSSREKDVVVKQRPKLAQKVFVVPNLVDQKKYQRGLATEKKLVSFIGTLDYYPNVEAVNFICGKLAPLVKGELGDKKLVVAGHRAGEDLRRKCEGAGVELRVDLSDEEILDLYARTSVCLVPLMHGSGTRLKILEARFSGCRIISTPLGREGIEDDGIVTCELEEFAAQLKKLLATGHPAGEVIPLTFQKNYDTQTWYLEQKGLLKDFLP